MPCFCHGNCHYYKFWKFQLKVSTNTHNKLCNFIFIDSMEFEYFLFLLLTMTYLMARMTSQVSPNKVIMVSFRRGHAYIYNKSQWNSEFHPKLFLNYYIFQALGFILGPTMALGGYYYISNQHQKSRYFRKGPNWGPEDRGPGSKNRDSDSFWYFLILRLL